MFDERYDNLDLSQPSAKALAALLRNPSKWPKGFSFNYSFCDSCAMGLSARVWDHEPTPGAMMEKFGISAEDSNRIFMRRRIGNISAENIAADLDALVDA